MASLNGKPNRKQTGRLVKRDGTGNFLVITRKEKEELVRVNSAPAPSGHSIIASGEDDTVRWATFEAPPRRFVVSLADQERLRSS